MDNNITPKFPSRLIPLSEIELMSAWVNCDREPLVSICCATYNHVQWIEDAICGFLAQKTDFPFEVIVRDDASSDGTTEILRAYAAKYPKIVRLIVNQQNEYELGKKPATAWPSLVRGAYLALCEGDDFWTAEDKLQKQLDLLLDNPRAIMSVALTHCFEQAAGVAKFYKTTSSPQALEVHFEDDSFRLYFHTSTFLINAEVYSIAIDRFWKNGVFDDTALRNVLITFGSFLVLPEVVSVYRITGSGVYSSQNVVSQLEWAFKIYSYLHEVLPPKYARAQTNRMYRVAQRLSKHHLVVRNWSSATFWAVSVIRLYIRRVINFLIKSSLALKKFLTFKK